MRKLRLLTAILMAVFCLQFCGEFAEAAQTINGKAIGSVDDIVKEVNGGDLSLPKKGLITLRGLTDNDNTYLDVFASVFGADGSASAKRKIWSNPNPDVSITKTEEKPEWIENPSAFHSLDDNKKRWTVKVPVYEGEPKFYRPAVSRRLYNGKRALMFHNIAPNGSLKYFFKTLSNNRSEYTTSTTPDNLASTVSISDFSTYTSPAFSNAENLICEVYGTGAMSVKGYDREIFVAASGVSRVDNRSDYQHDSWSNHYQFRRWVYPKVDQEVRLEFFAVSADQQGNMTHEALTDLTRTTPFRNKPYIVSMAVGDFDGDKYNNELALMINSRKEIRLFVYRLNFSNGKLDVKSLGDKNGMQVYTTDLWYEDLDAQPVSDMTAGDFNGDGKDEIAVIYKAVRKATEVEHEKGFRGLPRVGDVKCRVYEWSTTKKDFNSDESSKTYDRTEMNNSGQYPDATVAAVVGLRAVAADLDGDGKSEIVTLLLGSYRYKSWDASYKTFDYREDQFSAYPHLAVWTFNRGSIKPIHDDNHVKGGGESGEYRYNWGPLYDMSDNKSKGLLMNQPHLEYRYIWYSEIHKDQNKEEGTNLNRIKYMYAPRMFSITAGPFTGKLGNARTVDDIAVAWKDNNGNDCVTIFKTKLNAS